MNSGENYLTVQGKKTMMCYIECTVRESYAGGSLYEQ